MRILSSEVQQVFKAYAKQLRVDHAKGKSEPFRESRAKGFEKVEISDEARALAAGTPELAQKQAPIVRQPRAQAKNEESDETEKNEKDSDTTKDESGDSRSKRVER